jgi:hypothetical protein
MLSCFENIFEYMEHLINVRIESLKVNLENNAEKLVSKINKTIRADSSIHKDVKKKFKLNDHKRNKKFKINSKKIGFFCFQLNKKIPKNVWRSEKVEELVQKICNKIL